MFGSAAAAGSSVATTAGVSAASAAGLSAGATAAGAFTAAEVGLSSATAFAGSGLMSGLSALTFGDILTGSLTAFTALSSIAGGQAAGAAAETSARFESFAAQQELLKGRKEALEISQRTVEALEQNMVNALAAGVTGEGSVAAAQEAIAKKGEQETSISRSNAAISSAARRARADQLRLEASSSRFSGYTNAASSVGNFFLRRAVRG
jgi:hypothetical protein